MNLRIKAAVNSMGRRLTLLLAVWFGVALAPAHAASTVISNAPITSTRSAQAKPNIMLLMDTSDSMSYTHMPDEVETLTTPLSVGYKNSQCNALYYNPTTKYDLPRRADGSFFPAANFNAAPYDAFDVNSFETKNLVSEFQAYDNGSTDVTRQTVQRPTWSADPLQAAYYYVYQGTQPLSYGAAPCTDADDRQPTRAATGGGTWVRVTVGANTGVSPNPADERQNFANWYAYYRTRMQLTKTAVSLSFNPLNDSYRVGFITVEPNIGTYPAVNPARFLALNDFVPGAANQRENWYAKLFSQKPAGTSPAREGLARVGRYYANKFDGINSGMGGVDPIQYSCQQNFTILTTDGYWNAQHETNASALGGGFKGGPVEIDGQTWVGEQDGAKTDGTGNTPYGVWDGNTDSVRTTTDRVDTFTDLACTLANATYLTKTQSLSSVQRYTKTSTQTAKTTQFFTSDTSYDTIATDRYELQTQQYELSTQAYTQQTLNYSEHLSQIEETDVPFTTKVVTSYTTTKTQLVEQTSQVQQTETPWTMKVSEQYISSATQWTAKVTQQKLSTAQYTFGQTQLQAQTYQIIKTDASNEKGVLSDNNCQQTNGTTCTKLVKNAWTGVASCSDGAFSGVPNNIYTECRTTIPVPLAPIGSCDTSKNQTTDANGVTTTCRYTVLTQPHAVASCPGNSQAQTPDFTLTICQTLTISDGPVDTSSTPCQNGQSTDGNFYTTVCSLGPLTRGPAGSAPCTSSPGVTPDFVNISCVHIASGPTYVAPGSCVPQTGSPGNGWIATVTCTPGTPSAPHFVAGCTPGTVGSGATTVEVTCSAPINPTSNLVASCTNGLGTTFDNTAPFTQRVCTNSGPQAQAATPSAFCNSGTDPAQASNNFVTTTCTVTNPPPTYVASSTSCAAQTASASNGGATVTCTTPPATGPFDTIACVNGPHGSGASQYTATCGLRGLVDGPSPQCTVSTVDNGNGTVSECRLTIGAPIPVSFCAPPNSDTINPNPPYDGMRCNYVAQTNFVDPPCTPGTNLPTVNNNYTTSTCTVRNPTGPTVVANCQAGTAVGSGPGFVNSTCTKTPQTPATPINGSCVDGSVTFDGSVTSTCAHVVQTSSHAVASCAPGSVRDSSSPYAVTTCVDHTVQEFSPDQASCVAQTKNVANGQTAITCNTPPPVTVPSAPCTAGPSTTGSPTYINTMCAATPATPFVPDNCTSPGTVYDPATFETKTCRIDVVQPATLSTCTAGQVIAPSGDPWITETCSSGTATGFRRVYDETETVTTGRYSGNNLVGTTHLISQTTLASGHDTDGLCHIASNPLDPLPGPTHPMGWPSFTTAPVAATGSSNSLADVAQYYYVTDLRPEYPNTGDQAVPATGSGPLDDRLTSQHMTTFTIALGVSGTLEYRPDYRTPAGDFAKILNYDTTGKVWPQWPDTTLDYVSSSADGSTGPALWEDPRSIDDFWHTAVNGRGQYFSAKDPRAVVNGVSAALAGINSKLAAASPGAVTSPEPTPGGNNETFTSSYVTVKWTGDVEAHQIDLSTGATQPAVDWSAGALLKTRVGAQCDSRHIFLLHPGKPNNLTPFTWGTKTCDAQGSPALSLADGLDSTEQDFFGSTTVVNLSQYPEMTDGTNGSIDQRTLAANGKNLVNFLRGQSGLEGFQTNDATHLYRTRDAVLGDIIDAQPIYVQAPFAEYQENNYPLFKSNNSLRAPMLYVAANDGMLHAFAADASQQGVVAGTELWAVIPSAVLPNLFRLADNNYANLHQYYVDATPTVGDAYDASSGGLGWRTILVGGLNSGGRGYYALDVTDPATPKALWEFKRGPSCGVVGSNEDCNLGLTYSQPVITKLADGTWVVMFTSGYNNVSPGDGGGYLYVLDAFSGALKFRLATGAGDSSTPSNLGQINNFVNDAFTDNTTQRVYGGDMLGNIWRFDVNNNQPPAGVEATLLGTAKDPSIAKNPQPITTRPELAELGGLPMVFVATGRLLGAPDITDTQQQSVYGIVDPLVDPAFPDLRAALKPLKLTQTNAADGPIRTVTCVGTSSECSSAKGWVIDLPESGERVNVNMQLVFGTLVFGSNVPDTNQCTTGGHSLLNFVDFSSGLAVQDSPNSRVSEFLSNALLVGFNIIRLPANSNGSRPFVANSRFSTATSQTNSVPTSTPPLSNKRISWRELTQ